MSGGYPETAEEDEKAGGKLVDSLYYYLLCGKGLAAAARRLKIHKSTLGYRLLKIEDIVHLDLKDERICQMAVYSCEIVRYLKLLVKQ